MKLNNIEDFSKNNWYSITTGSTTGQSAAENQVQTQPLDQSSSSAAIVTKLKQQQDSNSKQVESAGLTESSNKLELINIEEDLIEEEEQNIYINPSVNYPITMPSKEVLRAQQESLKMSQQPATISQQQLNPGSRYPSDVLAVEELVHEIKENLRLKSRPHGRTSRPSPYHIPCRSWNDHTQQQQQNISSLSTSSICSNNSSNLSSYNSQENHLNNCCATTTTTTASISNYKNPNYHSHHHHHQSHYHQRYKKEQDIDDPYELLQALLKSKNLVKEAVRRLQLNTISPKQKKRSYFYDSDDDSRSPMFRVCQLEL